MDKPTKECSCRQYNRSAVITVTIFSYNAFYLIAMMRFFYQNITNGGLNNADIIIVSKNILNSGSI